MAYLQRFCKNRYLAQFSAQAQKKKKKKKIYPEKISYIFLYFRKRKPRKKNSCIPGNGNPKKASYISGNGNPEKILYISRQGTFASFLRKSVKL